MGRELVAAVPPIAKRINIWLCMLLPNEFSWRVCKQITSAKSQAVRLYGMWMLAAASRKTRLMAMAAAT